MNKRYALIIGTLVVGLLVYLPRQVTHANTHHHAPVASTHEEDHPEQSFQFLLTEMAIHSDSVGSNGKVTFRSNEKTEFIFKNVGKIHHEVLFGRGAILRDGLLIREYNEHFLANVEVDVYLDGIEVEVNGLKEIELDPGKELRIVFTPGSELTGDWEIGCFMAGHYEMGMKVGLRIE